VAASAETALTVAARALARGGVAHALIGACARNVYAPPRATRDINLSVLADAAQYARIRDELRLAGFDRVAESRAVPDAALPNAAVFSDASGTRIDLLFAHSPFERQAIARAAPTDFPTTGIVVAIVRIEDLLVYKILASRPHDLIDIEEITRAQSDAGAEIDWAYVEHECAHWDAQAAVRAVRPK
jgi:hypothetical protein